MPNPENLTAFTEGFVITDDEVSEDLRDRDRDVKKVVFSGLASLYKGIDWMSVDIDSLSETVYFVSFEAEEERELTKYSNLSPSERNARDEVQNHLTRNIND